MRKLGLETEMTTSAGGGRIHMYVGNGANKVGSAANTMTDATTLWSTDTTLKNYDIVILSCEGGQRPATKPQTTLDAMKAYADAGGRVFSSHWHNIWIGGNFQDQGNNPTLKPAVWDSIVTQWAAADGTPQDPVSIDETANPKGTAFANWMVNVMGS
nr:carboxypeptidase regulatory-like domain-containing protein [Deltaproteobacteria bacterium]